MATRKNPTNRHESSKKKEVTVTNKFALLDIEWDEKSEAIEEVIEEVIEVPPGPIHDPVLVCRNVQFNTLSKSEGYLNIQSGKDNFNVEEVNIEKKYMVGVHKYEMNLLQWLEYNKQIIFINSYGEHLPSSYAREAIKGIIIAFCQLKCDYKKGHGYLHVAENFILSVPVYDHQSQGFRNSKNTHPKKPDFTVRVHILHNKQGDKKDDVDGIISLIFNTILRDKCNDLPEWANFRKALRDKKFFFAERHPCLMALAKRFGIINTIVDDLNCPIYGVNSRIVCALKKMQFFDSNWEEKINTEMPIVRILKYGREDINDGSATSDERNRVPNGIRFLRMIRNTYIHIWEREPRQDSHPTGEIIYKHMISDKDKFYIHREYLDFNLRQIFPNYLTDLCMALLVEDYLY